MLYPKCQWCNWHLSFLALLHTSGKESKASLTENGSQEAEECAQEERQEVKQLLEPVSHRALVTEQRKQVATPLECRHSEALSSSEAAMHGARPTVNLLNILQQGWDLRSVCILGCRSCWLLPSSSSLAVFPFPSHFQSSPFNKNNYEVALTWGDVKNFRPWFIFYWFVLAVRLSPCVTTLKPRERIQIDP